MSNTELRDDNIEIFDNRVIESLKLCGCTPTCEWCYYYDPRKVYDKPCYDRRNEDFDSLINYENLKIKRFEVLAELGNMRANDYRVMRDRALKAEAEVEKLQKEIEWCRNAIEWYSGSGAGAINRCPREGDCQGGE